MDAVSVHRIATVRGIQQLSGGILQLLGGLLGLRIRLKDVHLLLDLADHGIVLLHSLQQFFGGLSPVDNFEPAVHTALR